jgi:hypothetical protein
MCYLLQGIFLGPKQGQKKMVSTEGFLLRNHSDVLPMEPFINPK